METNRLYDETWTRPTGVSRIVGMVKNTSTLYVYFEVDCESRNLLEQHFSSSWGGLPLYLCVYDVTDVWFDGYNAPLVVQIRVPSDAESWYINSLPSARNYVIDVATTTSAQRLFCIARSKVISTPPPPASSTGPQAQFRTVPPSTDDVVPYPYETHFDGYHLGKRQEGH